MIFFGRYTNDVERICFMFEWLLNGYQALLHDIAEFTVYTLELIGIIIIIIGSFRAILQVVSSLRKKNAPNVVISLGRALAIALEFKMGAEIVNTVIVRDLKELCILGVVIALRAILAVLIHWEIKKERVGSQENNKPTQSD